jgi:hypothetical protein
MRGSIGFLGSQAHQRNLQIIGEKSYRVQNDALLAEGPGE